MKKRLISLLLVVVMLLGMLPTAALAAETTFDDVSGHWAETAITQLAAKDIINGSHGKYRPDDSITRGEVATIFNNLMGYQVAAENTFTDLPTIKWYTKNMLRANAAGIFMGSDGQIKPEANITRQEFFVTLARLLVLSDSTVAGKFTDQSSIPDWAAPKMNALAQAGFLSGVDNGDGTYRAAPGSSITRAEVAVMVGRAFPGIYNTAGTYSDPVAGNAVVAKSDITLSGTKVSGDLFITPGVGDGEVTLDSVNAPKRTFIDGGGANSVIFKGESVFGSIITNKNGQEKPLTLKLEGNTTADKITITKESAKTNIVVSGGAKVAAIEAANPGTAISGDGKVSSVNITANDVSVSTPNTKVTVAEGVTGAMVGGKAVEGGKTVTTNSTGTGLSTGTSGGNNNNPDNPDVPVQPEGTWAVRFETNGGDKINPSYVVKGEKLNPVPQAKKADALFLGWFTDESCAVGKEFYASNPITADITLYAKYSNMDKQQEKKVDSFALSDVGSDKTFTINAPGMTADQVKNAITVTNIGAGGTPELVVKGNNDGSFTVSAKDGFREGSAVTLNLGDGLTFGEKGPDGTAMGAEIRNASFTVEKELVNNLEINDELKNVKIPEGAVVTEPVYEEGTINVTPGTFTTAEDNIGGVKLEDGALITLYDQVAPELRAPEEDYTDDRVIYAKIIDVDSDDNPANGNQVTFETPTADQVLGMPESLPLDVAEFVEGSYTGADDLDFAIPTATLVEYWKDYDHIGLDAATTIDAGDTLVLMGVGLTRDAGPDEIDEDNVVYGTVASVTNEGDNTVVSFTKTTAEAIVSNTQSYYTKQDVDNEAIAKAANDAGIPAQIEQQALESGFAEQALLLLGETATKTEGFQQQAEARVGGAGTEIKLPSFGDDWEPNIDIPTIVTKGITVEAKITKDTAHFGEGLMCQLFIKGTIKVPLSTDPLGPSLDIDLTATFQQELRIVVDVDGGIEWKWAAFIPYPGDFYMNTNVDVFNYTAIAVHAIVGTHDNTIDLTKLGELEKLKGLDISSEISKVLGLGQEEQMEETKQLFEMYADMLQNDTDYITLVEQQVMDLGFGVMGLLKVGIKADFVIKANINLVLGSSLSYECGNRYNFWFKLISRESGSSNTQLIDEKMNFQFYIMGMIGLRVGVAMEVYVAFVLPKDLKGGTYEVAAVGVALEAGAYVELYGYFVYTVESLNKVVNSEMSGALYVDFGVYLEIGLFARVADGLAGATHPLYEKKWPLLSAGDRLNVFDFTYAEIPADEVYIIKNYTTDYLPDSYWSVKGMDMMEGDIEDVIAPRDKFVYTLSNPAFTFDQEKGQINVEVPKNVRYMTCDMTIKWAGAKLAFSTGELMRTIHLVWTNLADDEMSLRHNISVVANGKVIWSKVVGEGEQYTLPAEAELKELLGYNTVTKLTVDENTNVAVPTYGKNPYKYTDNSALTYKNELGTNTLLDADRDRVYTVNAELKEYTLVIKDVQQADGTTEDLTLTAKYGESFDLTALLASGTSDATKQGENDKPYTRFVAATSPAPEAPEPVTPVDPEKPQPGEIGGPALPAAVGAKPISDVIDDVFAEQLASKTYTYTAQYADNFVTATFNFVDSRGKVLAPAKSIKVELDNYPEFDYQAYALAMVEDKQYMVKRFDKPIEKLTADQTYTATCVLAIGSAYPIVFSTGDEGVTVDSVSRHNGAHLTLPRPEREGYTFAGWYEDEALTIPFTKTNMPTPTPADNSMLQANLEAAKKGVADAQATLEAAQKVVDDANMDATEEQLKAVTDAQTTLTAAQQAVTDAGADVTEELTKAVTDAQTALDAAQAIVDAANEDATEEQNNAVTIATEAKKNADQALADAQAAFDKADVEKLTQAVATAEAAATAAATAKTTADGAATAAQTALQAAQQAVTDAGASATQDQKDAVDAAQATLDENTAVAADAATAKAEADAALKTAQAALAAAKAQVLNLYAKWTGNTYTVTFDANAPGAVVDSVPKATTVTYGASYGKLRELRRSGYIFSGWFTAKTGGSAVTTVNTAKNHTLYAQWTPKTLIEDSYFTSLTPVTVDYNKAAHPFMLDKATGADSAVKLDSFIVQYKGRNPVYSANRWVWFVEKDENGETVKQNAGPIDSEQYDVMIYRPESDTHQMYKRTVPAGVTINKIDRTPANVHITYPTKAEPMGIDRILIDGGTATGEDVGDGVLQYQATFLGAGAGASLALWPASEKTSSLSLAITTPASTMYIRTTLSESRNYNAYSEEGYINDAGEYGPQGDTYKHHIPMASIFKNVQLGAADPAMAEMNFAVEVKTAKATNAGTDSGIFFKLMGYHGNAEILFEQQMDLPHNDFQSGGHDTYYFNNKLFDPWSIRTFQFYHNGKGTASTWNCEFVKYTFEGTGIPAISKQISVNREIDGEEVYFALDPADPYNRKITAVGSFANWGGEHTVSATSTGKIAYTYDGTITDQYGTYNAYNHYDAPTIKVGTFDKNNSFIASPFAECVTYSNYGLEIDETKLYARMAAAELTSVTFTVKLDVPAASCKNASDEMFTKTITVTRT